MLLENRGVLRFWFVASLLGGALSAGCGGTPAPEDAGSTPDLGAPAPDGGMVRVDQGTPPTADAGPGDLGGPDANGCRSDAQCDDGTFCNGAERCAPSDPLADARGCAPPSSATPCMAGRMCLEDMDRCQTQCDIDGDADDDGVNAMECGGADCNDGDALAFPGATEVCDNARRDEDCNPATFGTRDLDGDGAVDAVCCNGTTCGTDCDDQRADVRPGATEVCNDRDEDCDGMIDEGTLLAGFEDRDRDGFGDATRARMQCPGTLGFSTMGTDCDDVDPARNPNQVEVCDMKDNDCDTLVDDGPVEVPWYRDADGDGFGNARGGIVVACAPPAGHVLLATDCDDTDPMVSPRVAERCNGRDDDCNGRADYRVAAGNGEDDDVDGYADPACALPMPDCDDLSAWSNPGRTELCDMRDNDCDGMVDDGAAAVLWYSDIDRDGYGASSDSGVQSCTPLAGRSPRNGDCDDGDVRISPAIPDDCTGRTNVDDDCNGVVDDDATPLAVFTDGDRDGYGVGTPMLACGTTTLALRAGDCNDAAPLVNPGATQACTATTTTDEDCDGLVGCEDPSCAMAAACMINFRLTLVEGAGQTARSGEYFTDDFVVRLTTLAGAPMAGRAVTISSTSGGAGAAPATVMTDASGIAIFTVIAGLAAGPDTLRFTSPGTATITADVTVTAVASGNIAPVLSIARASGTTGVPGPSLLARVQNVSGLAIASDGTMYVSDTTRHAVYRISPRGAMSVFAGTPGMAGFAGDFGDPLMARLSGPSALALDETAGRLYVTDRNNNRIRVIDLAANTIRTLAGGGATPAPTYGDGGNGNAATLLDVTSLARLSDGRLLAFDSGIPRLRVIDPVTRRIDTFLAENNQCSGAIRLYTCGGGCFVHVDAADRVFVSGGFGGTFGASNACNVRGVARVLPDFSLKLLAGTTSASAVADGSYAARATWVSGDFAIEPAGNLLIAEPTRHVVWRVDGATGLVSRAVGMPGMAGSSGDFGVADAARLNVPSVLAFTPGGDLLIGSATSYDLRRVLGLARSTRTVVQLTAGTGAGQSVQVGAPIPTAFQVIARTVGGTPVPVASLDVTFEPLNPGMWLAATTTSTATDGSASTTARAALDVGSQGLRIRGYDASGDELMGSPINFSVTATAPATGTIFTALNASRSSGLTGIPGPSTEARTNAITGVAIASDNTIYASSGGLNRVFQITPTGLITVLVGDGTAASTGDNGPAAAARVNNPAGLALDAARNRLFIVETNAARVRVVDLASANKTITTYAGGGSAVAPGYGDGGLAINAALLGPTNVAVATDGTVYISDDSHNRIRRVEPVMRFIDAVVSDAATCSPTAALTLANCGNGCGVALDAMDRLYVAGNWQSTSIGTTNCPSTPAIVRIDGPALRTHIAGRVAGATTNGGPATAALLVPSAGIDVVGNSLYLAEESANRVRRVDLMTGNIDLFAGTGTAGATGDYGPANACTLQTPTSVDGVAGGHVAIGLRGSSGVRVVW